MARGDVVGLLSYNCPEFLETVFAANYLDGIAMPINWRLAAPEVRYILEHAEARVFVHDDELVNVADEAARGMDGLLRSSVSGLSDLRTQDVTIAPEPSAADDVHRLMYTSGTTGRAKGVMITHANLALKK